MAKRVIILNLKEIYVDMLIMLTRKNNRKHHLLIHVSTKDRNVHRSSKCVMCLQLKVIKRNGIN